MWEGMMGRYERMLGKQGALWAAEPEFVTRQVEAGHLLLSAPSGLIPALHHRPDDMSP
jgi:hypothetical protein